MYFHFISFLLNVTLWLIAGLFIGKMILRIKKSRIRRTRFYFTTITAALLGGLLAELSNGSPKFGISLVNLFVSAFAVIVAIFLAYPLHTNVLRRKMSHAIIETFKTLRLSLESLRK